MLTNLNNVTIEDLALIGLVAIAIWNARRAFEAWTARSRPEAEPADEIAQAIADQTTDLLDALTEANATLDAIRNSTDYLEESERDFNAEEDAQRSGESWRDAWVAPRTAGTSLHRWIVAMEGRRGAHPDVVIQDEPVDLSKHD